MRPIVRWSPACSQSTSPAFHPDRERHAHVRSGDRIAIASYLGGGDRFDRALADFAEAYADVNERDYQALRAAVDDGRLPAEEGV